MIGAKKSEFKDDNGFLSTEHTFYIDGIEEIIPAATSQYSLINKAPISEGVMFIQTVARANGGVESGFEYHHKDYLGSTEVVTDDNGYRLISFAYDAFGSRRHADWSKALTDSELKTLAKTLCIKNRRGFTGHEHLDRTGIIHMNGRIYDPVLARFLSPDPLVSNPYFSQSYNRYSYVLNNPLGMTDPSGYSPSCTSDDGCTEARTERLAGPSNYISHSRHYKKQKGTQSRAAGKDKKDKAGEVVKSSSEGSETPNKLPTEKEFEELRDDALSALESVKADLLSDDMSRGLVAYLAHDFNVKPGDKDFAGVVNGLIANINKTIGALTKVRMAHQTFEGFKQVVLRGGRQFSDTQIKGFIKKQSTAAGFVFKGDTKFNVFVTQRTMVDRNDALNTLIHEASHFVDLDHPTQGTLRAPKGREAINNSYNFSEFIDRVK